MCGSRGALQIPRLRSPGFPVEIHGVDALHAPFFAERRTRGPVQRCVAGNPGRDDKGEGGRFQKVRLLKRSRFSSPWVGRRPMTPPVEMTKGRVVTQSNTALNSLTTPPLSSRPERSVVEEPAVSFRPFSHTLFSPCAVAGAEAQFSFHPFRPNKDLGFRVCVRTTGFRNSSPVGTAENYPGRQSWVNLDRAQMLAGDHQNQPSALPANQASYFSYGQLWLKIAQHAGFKSTARPVPQGRLRITQDISPG